MGPCLQREILNQVWGDMQERGSREGGGKGLRANRRPDRGSPPLLLGTKAEPQPPVFQGALAPRPGLAQAGGSRAVFLSTFTAWSEGPRFLPDQLQPRPASPPAHFSMWTLWAEGEALKPSWGVWDTHRARPRSTGSKSAGLCSRPAAGRWQ